MFLRLRDNIKDVSGQLNLQPKPLFDEANNEKVAQLLRTLESLLFDGTRTREFGNRVPFWNFLEHVATHSSSTQHNIIKDAVIDIDHSCCSGMGRGALRTGVGKARGWLRYTLNNATLANSLEFLKVEHRVIHIFFSDQSVFAQEEQINTLITMIRALKVVPFSLDVYHERLNTCERLDKMVEEQASDFVNYDGCTTSFSSCFIPPLTQVSDQDEQNDHTSPVESPSINCMDSPVLRQITPSSYSAKCSSIENFLYRFESSFDELTSKVNDLTLLCFGGGRQFHHEDHGSGDDEDSGTSFYNNHQERTCNDPILGFAENSNKMFIGLGLAVTGFVEGIHQSMNKSSVSDLSLFVDPTSILSAPSLFGTPLQHLIKHEYRCPQAFVEPRLGIPTQILMLIDTLTKFLDTNFLFRTECSPSSVSHLKAQLDAEKGVKKNTEVHVIASTLLDWLYMLPEPLLGYDSFDAFIACMNLESDDDKIRNLSLLVQEIPWYNKNVLIKLLSMLHEALLSKNADSNGLNAVSISLLFTPVLLRSERFRDVYSSTEDGKNNAIMAAAMGSATISFIIRNQETVLKALKEDLVNVQEILNKKISRINYMRNSIMKKFSVDQSQNSESPNAEGNVNSDTRDFYDIVLGLWKALETSEMLMVLDMNDNDSSRMKNDIKNGEEEFVDLISLLSHRRWSVCGFPPVVRDRDALLMRKRSMENGLINSDEINDLNPLYCFENKKNGYMAIILFTYFLRHHGEKAAIIVKRFATERRQYCSLVHVCLQLTWFVTDVLRLTPLAIATNTNNVISCLAKEKSWNVLNEGNCVEELFCLALLTFDDIWIHFTEKLKRNPSLQIHEISTLSTRSMLLELLESDLESTEQMWGLWSELRVRRQMAAVEATADIAAKTAIV